MIAFVGAGRASKGLGLYLKKVGLEIAGYYDKDSSKGIRAGELTSSRNFINLEELIVAAKIIILSTGDDDIAEAGKELKEKLLEENVIVGHLSGMHNSSLLKEILPNSQCFSLHPLHSFSGGIEDLKALKESSFTIEGDDEAVFEVSERLKMTGNKILKIESSDKVLYHVACVFASNYITTLVYKSLSFFESMGISKEDSKKMLMPLVKGTVENLFEKGPEKSLTGPIARGDVLTIKKHLLELKKQSNESENLYKLLAREALDLASLELLKDKNKINNIKKMLKDGLNYEEDY